MSSDVVYSQQVVVAIGDDIVVTDCTVIMCRLLLNPNRTLVD
jgi:hypothetical protein